MTFHHSIKKAFISTTVQSLRLLSEAAYATSAMTLMLGRSIVVMHWPDPGDNSRTVASLHVHNSLTGICKKTTKQNLTKGYFSHLFCHSISFQLNVNQLYWSLLLPMLTCHFHNYIYHSQGQSFPKTVSDSGDQKKAEKGGISMVYMPPTSKIILRGLLIST